MIWSIKIDIPVLLSLLKNYQWPRPPRCLKCDSTKIWGHGFVYRLFDFSNKPVPMKRYRCANCNRIIQLRPEGFFTRFQAPVDTIRGSIRSLVQAGKPLKGISRQRQAHWLGALKRRATALYGVAMDLIEAFEKMIERNIVPVAHLPCNQGILG